MYKSPGVRSGAWLTEKAEAYNSPKGISNYGLVPVTYKNADKDWEKTKKGIGQDFQNLKKYAGTASETAKEGIKKAYDWTRIWGPLTLGSAGGLAYVCTQHPGDEYGWLKGVLGGALVGFTAKLVSQIEKRKSEYRKRLLEREKMRVQGEIRDLLKELVRTPVNGDLDRKIGYKERLKILSKTLERGEEIGPERINQMKNEEQAIRSGMEELYRIQ